MGSFESSSSLVIWANFFYLGDPTLINAVANGISEYIPGLMAGAKRAAQNADDEATRQKITAQTKSVGDAATALGTAAKVHCLADSKKCCCYFLFLCLKERIKSRPRSR